MLPKCTLCRPIRGGKSHKSQRFNWTRGRLLRWLAGERVQLWLDLPQYKKPKPKQYSVEALKKKHQERCIDLTGEEGLSQVCRSLISPPPLGQTAEVTVLLRDRHPSCIQPIDLSVLGDASNALVPLVNVNLVEQCIR